MSSPRRPQGCRQGWFWLRGPIFLRPKCALHFLAEPDAGLRVWNHFKLQRGSFQVDERQLHTESAPNISMLIAMPEIRRVT